MVNQDSSADTEGHKQHKLSPALKYSNELNSNIVFILLDSFPLAQLKKLSS